jgi:uncharacterized protein (DUF2236 family)
MSADRVHAAPSERAADTVVQLRGPRRGEPQPFGPGSILWDDLGDVLALSTTLGAFMLQAMHPAISAGVDEFSTFRSDPFGRLVRSLDSVMLWVYGGPAAIDEGRRLLELHKPIKGLDAYGKRYRALDADTYAWVHATAFVNAVVTHPLLKGREMTDAEQDALYGEMLQLGDILRIPRRAMPQSVPEYWDYYHAMVRDTLERTEIAEVLLQMTDRPPLPLLPRSLQTLALPGRTLLGHFLYLLLGGGLTADAREKLGITWTLAHGAELRTLMAIARPARHRLPERLRYAPIAYHARRHAQSIQTIRSRATDRGRVTRRPAHA